MKISLLATCVVCLCTAAFANDFPVRIEPKTVVSTPYYYGRVVVPPSPVLYQTIFVGGVDTVQTTATYGSPAGQTKAKQWHDFIGFADATPAEGGLGFVVVNHEMLEKNPMIGDGGGMTMFKVGKKASGGIEVLEQTLADGRKGKFFNVDFANTVGETYANCGGMEGQNGRIWTAEEWYYTSNASIASGFSDTTNFTIGEKQPSGFTGLDGKSVPYYQNFNWMVEIDARNAKAVRKQYNWSRQGFEAGITMPDNKTVYLAEDGDAGKSFFTKFVADEPGDFTKGKLYVYKQNAGSLTGSWVEMPNNPATDWNILVAPHNWAQGKGITGFTRLEWIAYNKTDGKVYITETGTDRPAARYKTALADGWTLPKHLLDRAASLGVSADSSAYTDFYGRVLVFDPADNSIRSFLEGGPFIETKDATPERYPSKHFSNPDGLGFLYVNGKTFMVIEEDLNGTSMGRMPNQGVNTTNCEAWLLDMSKEPTIDNLYLLAVSPLGSEITGVRAIDNGNTLLINSQHPLSVNETPFNNSLTFAVNNLQQLITSIEENNNPTGTPLKVFPNPATRELQFDTEVDAALYNAAGERVRVVRGATTMDIRDIPSGSYYIMTADGATHQVVVQK
jgi:uncharacterized protein